MSSDPPAASAITPTALPESEWHEDYGEVLWWRFPIVEAPYVGSPLCSDWPFEEGDLLGWTRFVCPGQLGAAGEPFSRAAQPPNDDDVLDFLVAYYGFPNRAEMESPKYASWLQDIRDEVKLIQSWATLKGANGNEKVPSVRKANDGAQSVLSPLSEGALALQRKIAEAFSRAVKEPE